MIGQVLLGLSILIVLHEGGHYLAARAFGIKVEKFYLFFDAWGFKLFKFKKGDTEYGMGWLPLGGYVKIAGMIDESMDKEAMKLPPQPWEFRSKPAWQRLIVMLGGVTVNLFLGILIFWMLAWANGEDRLPISKLKYGIHAGEIGRNIGLQDGDTIWGVDGKKVKYFEDLKTPDLLMGDDHRYNVLRNGDSLDIKLPIDLLDKLSDGKAGDFFIPRYKFKVVEVTEGKNAKLAGIEVGDLFESVNDSAVEYFDQFQTYLQTWKGKTATFKLKRGSELVSLKCAISSEGTIGIGQTEIGELKYDHQTYGFVESASVGWTGAFSALSTNIKGLGKVFSGKVSASKSVQGPIGIAKIYGSTWDWARFWMLTGMLSLVLAFMNLLPIPALDGGHVVFLLIEILRGKPASEKILERAQMVGMIILLTLMVLIFGNDIYKLITG